MGSDISWGVASRRLVTLAPKHPVARVDFSQTMLHLREDGPNNTYNCNLMSH